MTNTVQVTLDREDWERILRMTHNAVQVAEHGVEDANDWDDDEGPDTDLIEAREQSAREARAFNERVTAAMPVESEEAAPRQAGTAPTGEV